MLLSWTPDQRRTVFTLRRRLGNSSCL